MSQINSEDFDRMNRIEDASTVTGPASTVTLGLDLMNQIEDGHASTVRGRASTVTLCKNFLMYI